MPKFLKNKIISIPFILLILILILGAFFRLYRINEYMIFLGDEGRDVLVVKRMLVDHIFTLLGPITSVGSMYMGPVYYYMMAPALLLANFNPVGPSIMVALFSTATIFLIYYLASRYFSQRAGLIAAFFYAISPLSIMQGRSSWNPNAIPFFSTLMMICLFKVIIDKKYNYLFYAGLLFGVLIQLHYTSLYLLIVLIAALILTKTKVTLKSIVFFIIGSIITFSPFLTFELRHDFTNTRAVIHFLTTGSEMQGLNSLGMFHTFADVLVRIFWRLLIIESAEIAKIAIVFTLGILAYMLIKREKTKAVTILLVWLFGGILSFMFYGGVIYDYYFVGMFAVPFIIWGIFIDKIFKIKKIGLWTGVILILSVAAFNFKQSPILNQPSNMVGNTQTIARFVYDKVDHKPYNFALIAGHNSDHAYRYFLELWGAAPVTIQNPVIDPQRKSVTDDLYIVCEEKVCKPLGHPLWEIAGFGPAEIADEWKVSTARVLHLVRYKGDQK